MATHTAADDLRHARLGSPDPVSTSAAHADNDQLRRLHLAVMSMGSDLDLSLVLHRIVEAAVELVDARYGAIGVLDDDRTLLTDFITAGLTPEVEAQIGARPKGHGILGLTIIDPEPLRLDDLNLHPDRFGFPVGHPSMRTFLGVPVLVGGDPYGNLYLTDKRNGQPFTDIDQELAVALAAAAGMAIEKARLHARLRRSDVVEDRDRIARDLHDTVVQRLFATGLTLHSALRFVDGNAEVAGRIEQAIDELDRVVREVRTTVFELHTAVGADGGIRRKLLQLGDELSNALGFRPSFEFDGPVDACVTDEVAPHLLAAVGEALANVARHARSLTASVLVQADGRSLCATIDDEGIGPGGLRVGGHGLSNLARRANDLGGTSTLEPRPGGGSRLRWQIAT